MLYLCKEVQRQFGSTYCAHLIKYDCEFTTNFEGACRLSASLLSPSDAYYFDQDCLVSNKTIKQNFYLGKEKREEIIKTVYNIDPVVELLRGKSALVYYLAFNMICLASFCLTGSYKLYTFGKSKVVTKRAERKERKRRQIEKDVENQIRLIRRSKRKRAPIPI